MNCNFSSPNIDKPYGVGKLSISEASICSFGRIGQKIENDSFFNFLPENLEKFHSTDLNGAPLERSTTFLNRSSTCCKSMESYWLAELKYAIFSRAGRKTKKLPRSKLFLSMAFGLLEGSTILLQYSATTHTPF